MHACFEGSFVCFLPACARGCVGETACFDSCRVADGDLTYWGERDAHRACGGEAETWRFEEGVTVGMGGGGR